MANKIAKKTGHAYQINSSINSPSRPSTHNKPTRTLESKSQPEEPTNKDLPKEEDQYFAIKVVA